MSKAKQTFIGFVIMSALLGGAIRCGEVVAAIGTKLYKKVNSGQLRDACRELCYKGYIVAYCWDNDEVYYSTETCDDGDKGGMM